MSVVLQILAFWIPLSCVICPVVTWAFFRSERGGQEEADAVRHDGTVIHMNKWSMSKQPRRTI